MAEFKDFVCKTVSVPKREVEQKIAEERRERASELLAHAAPVHRRADRRREDVSGVLPPRAGNERGLELARPVGSQCFDGELGQR